MVNPIKFIVYSVALTMLVYAPLFSGVLVLSYMLAGDDDV